MNDAILKALLEFEKDVASTPEAASQWKISKFAFWIGAISVSSGLAVVGVHTFAKATSLIPSDKAPYLYALLVSYVGMGTSLATIAYGTLRALVPTMKRVLSPLLAFGERLAAIRPHETKLLASLVTFTEEDLHDAITYIEEKRNYFLRRLGRLMGITEQVGIIPSAVALLFAYKEKAGAGFLVVGGWDVAALFLVGTYMGVVSASEIVTGFETWLAHLHVAKDRVAARPKLAP